MGAHGLRRGRRTIRTRNAHCRRAVTYCTINAPEERPVRKHTEYHVYPEVRAVGTVLTSIGNEERNAVSDPRASGGAVQAPPPWFARAPSRAVEGLLAWHAEVAQR